MTRAPRTPNWLKASLVAGAAIWLCLAFASAWNSSPVVDEIPHLGSGLAVLEYDDYRLNPEHPPLFKVLAALPVYLFDRPDLSVVIHDEHGEGLVTSWFHVLQNEFGRYMLFERSPHPFRTLLIARIVPILTGLLGGLFAFLWGRELSGRAEGGAAAAFLLLFYPEYLGHSRFVTLDVPMLVSCAAASWMGWQWWRRPDWKRGGLFVAVAAVGSQVKLPVTFYVATLCALLVILSFASGKRVPWWKALLLALATVAAGWFAAWAGASFRYAAIAPGGKLLSPIPFVRLLHEENSGVNPLVRFASDHRLLPEITLATLAHVGSFEARRVSFLGEMRKGGSYLFFFVTILVKTPLPVLAGWIALAAGGAAFLARRRSAWTFPWRLQRMCVLLVPFLILFAVVVHSRANLGHRHALFLYFPMQVVLGAAIVRLLTRTGKRRATHFMRAAAAAVLATPIATTIIVYPHYATYINAIFGTPYRATEWLTDSNVDWGEDVRRAHQEVEKRGFKRVNLALFAIIEPPDCGFDSYIWLLPNYPFILGVKDWGVPDPTLPTVSSLNTLGILVRTYPQYYAREPDIIVNSVVIFLPD